MPPNGKDTIKHMINPRQPYQLGAHVVPAIWPYLAPEEFKYLTFPDERCSTCHACPKVATEGFHPDIRCCTYHPRMPNFLIGYGLQDPETAPILENMIAEGFATPEGLQATAHQFRSSLANHVDDKFGKSENVVCRFLDREKKCCQIYAYRNSVCCTFFCIHDGGDQGDEFWSALQNYMGQMETAIGQWAMHSLGIDPKSYFDIYDRFAEDPYASCLAGSEAWTDTSREKLWGCRFGQEAAFYKECANLVTQRKDDLVAIANQTPMYTPKKYDLAFRASLPESLRREFDESGGAGGTPASPKDLWYVLQVAHRNLWQLPEAGRSVVLSPAVKVLAAKDARYPWQFVLNSARLPCSEGERNFLQKCSQPQRISNDWLFSRDDVDGRKLVSQGIALGILSLIESVE